MLSSWQAWCDGGGVYRDACIFAVKQRNLGRSRPGLESSALLWETFGLGLGMMIPIRCRKANLACCGVLFRRMTSASNASDSTKHLEIPQK